MVTDKKWDGLYQIWGMRNEIWGVYYIRRVFDHVLQSRSTAFEDPPHQNIPYRVQKYSILKSSLHAYKQAVLLANIHLSDPSYNHVTFLLLLLLPLLFSFFSSFFYITFVTSLVRHRIAIVNSHPSIHPSLAFIQVERAGCGNCLVWAKHDQLVTDFKRINPHIRVRTHPPSPTHSVWWNP